MNGILRNYMLMFRIVSNSCKNRDRVKVRVNKLNHVAAEMDRVKVNRVEVTNQTEISRFGVRVSGGTPFEICRLERASNLFFLYI